jgi:ATP-binding cassette subfamily B (MDR/TAP) protein 7
LVRYTARCGRTYSIWKSYSRSARKTHRRRYALLPTWSCNASTHSAQDKPGALPLALTRGSIRFENVNFGYHEDRPIFRDLSFVVPGGKKVAIVGPSGCGKSTVLRLLYRFYDPAGGKIYIDDQDIHEVQLESVRKAIGVVPQDTPLFHSDIMHNVRYGRLEATDEEVRAVAVKANVHDTVMRLPAGYATKVGERGLMISGGEKQRLAVARVLLKDPPILFFDEAVRRLGRHFSSSSDTCRRLRLTRTPSPN